MRSMARVYNEKIQASSYTVEFVQPKPTSVIQMLEAHSDPRAVFIMSNNGKRLRTIGSNKVDPFTDTTLSFFHLGSHYSRYLERFGGPFKKTFPNRITLELIVQVFPMWNSTVNDMICYVQHQRFYNS